MRPYHGRQTGTHKSYGKFFDEKQWLVRSDDEIKSDLF